MFSWNTEIHHSQSLEFIKYLFLVGQVKILTLTVKLPLFDNARDNDLLMHFTISMLLIL